MTDRAELIKWARDRNAELISGGYRKEAERAAVVADLLEADASEITALRSKREWLTAALETEQGVTVRLAEEVARLKDGIALMPEWDRTSQFRGLVEAVIAAKTRPGISDGPDSGSFNIVLHGNWFKVAESLLHSTDRHLHTFRADGTCECGASPIPEGS